MRFAWLVLAGAGCAFHGGSPGTPGDATVDGTSTGDGSDAYVGTPRRKSITIDHKLVPAPLTNFQVCVDLASDAELAALARSDASDLFFTDAGGVAIPYEINRWDAATGRLLAWVKVAKLDDQTDTKIYVRYGDAAAATPPNPPMVWTGYSAVWHFDDSLATAAIADSTATHAGSGVGLTAASSVTGKLGNGIDFDGTSTYVTFTNMLTGNTPHTISAWVSQRTARNFDAIMTLGTPMNNKSRWFYTAYTQNTVATGFYNNDWVNVGTDPQNAGFTLLHWVYVGVPSNDSFVYRDGQEVANHTFANGVNTAGGPAYIAYSPINWGSDNFLNGTLDEVRISNTIRSPEWIATEYANQNTPSKFYKLGAEEVVP